MENREVKIEKIPLDKLIDTLVDLYNRGIDYIDVVGVPGKEFDRMGIAFTGEYMTDQGKKNFEGVDLEIEIKTERLTDEDLNELI
jgi:hypothetical protein|tara:strand:- start:283 stop:537 length:255 start_codon:yes stop_codon:yes gene_type:complete